MNTLPRVACHRLAFVGVLAVSLVAACVSSPTPTPLPVVLLLATVPSQRASSRSAPLVRPRHDDARIRQVSVGVYDVEASLFEELLQHPEAVAPGVQLEPVTEDTQFVGHRLSGIAPLSVLDRLGLADDDIIELINGESGRTPEAIDAARAAAQRTTQVAVVLRRNGFQKLMLYRLVYY